MDLHRTNIRAIDFYGDNFATVRQGKLENPYTSGNILTRNNLELRRLPSKEKKVPILLTCGPRARGFYDVIST